MSVFLLYAGCTQRPGRMLGEALGVEHGRREAMQETRYDYVIRFGCTSRIAYIPSVKTINRRESISNNTNKLRSLEIMRDAGIETVPFCAISTNMHYPVMGRRSNHMGGRDIQMIYQPRDLEFISEPFAYFTEFIPKRREFRVHVCNGRAIAVLEKVPDRENYDPLRCSHSGWRYRDWGWDDWTFSNLIAAGVPAVGAMGLDFGAIDIVEGIDGHYYVLEVNTAPGFTEESRTMQLYADEISRMIEGEH